jgi:phytoene desaturase
MQKYDVVIAGAGPGGLASAMLLARAGLKVKLLERKSQPGGRTSSIAANGFRFDLGPTFFLYPRVLGEIFETCGRHLMEDVPMVRLDPQYRLIFGSRKTGEPQQELNCTPNVEQMETALAQFCPADAANFQRFLSENRHKLAEFRPILESPFNNLKDTLSLPLLKLLPLVRPWASVDGDLKRYFSDERLRLAFSFQSKYLGMSPFRCPSLFTILSFLEYEYGVFHPIGGCSAVSEKMAEIAQELGVSISYDEPIEEILFDGKQVIGVRTPSGTIPTRRLVINADFAAAMEKLVPNRLRPRWTSQKLAKKRYSCSTYMLYLGIDGRYDHLAHHNIYISGKYSENLADIETRHRLSADPSVYVQNASITDPTLAPAGQSTLYVLAPVTHQHANVNWDTEKSRFRSVVMQQLAKLGMSDLEGRIRYEKVVTPADWQHDHAIYRGATFNLAHNLLQMLHLRPRNRFAEIGGMYLVGGGTHPGSGLPVIYESARITSKLLLEDMGASLPTTVPRHPTHHDDHSHDRLLVAAR